VPGLPRGVFSKGTHELLKNGAILVESGDEALAALASQLPADFKTSRHLCADEHNEHPILKIMPPSKIYTLDEIVEKSELSCSEVLKDTVKLVLAGKLEELPGKRFKKKKN
jgi:predicted Rossmann fold nucleotide-binding protein DprA/Smf involved in DNA uptake